MKGAQWMDIRSDRQKRLSYVELGKKYRIGPRTAKRYAESPQRPKYTLTGPKPTKLDLYGSEQVDENLHLNAVRACLKIEKVLGLGKKTVLAIFQTGPNTNSNIVNVSLIQNASDRTKFMVGVPVVVSIKPTKYLDFDANL